MLQLLISDHALPGMVLEYRMVARMVGGVIDPLRKKAVRCADGQWRVHCDWNHTRTATGRLSTCNPNMQAITKYKIPPPPLSPVTLVSRCSSRMCPCTRAQKAVGSSESVLESQLFQCVLASSRALKQGTGARRCRYTIAGEAEAGNNGLAPADVNVRDAFVARPGCAPSLSPSTTQSQKYSTRTVL